jgi:hypothetical protein
MGTVVGAWRLRLLLVLLIFAVSIYSAYGLFGNIVVPEVKEVDDNGYTPTDTDIAYNQSDLGVEESTSFTDVVFGLGDFFTFGNIDNTWVRLTINSVMSIVWISLGYIIFTFIKEWIPFV